MLRVFRGSSLLALVAFVVWARAAEQKTIPGVEARTPEQESAFHALDAAIAHYEADLEKMPHPGQRARSQSLLDAFKERRNAMQKQRFDQVKYDELRFDLNVEYQRLGQFLAKPNTPRPHRENQKLSRIELPGFELVMMPIADGTFVMGRPQGVTDGPPDEAPATRVIFTKPFWLGATEVTNGQWRRYAEAKRPSEGSQTSDQNRGSEQTDTFPVVNVSWDDAQAFCAWLTERERSAGRLPAGYVYSLPTEAQWEYACRAGNRGPDPEKLDEWSWHAGNSGGALHAVGTKRPNLWGLLDMQGNVAEWCLDDCGAYTGGTVTDLHGPKESETRRIRGGSALSAAGEIGFTRRESSPPQTRRNDLGFRVALVPAR